MTKQYDFSAFDAPKKSYDFSAFDEPEKTSKADSALGGFVEGSTFGFSDEIAGGVGGLMDYVSQGGKLDLKDYYKIRRDLVRESQKKAKADNPGTFMASEFAGGMVNPAGSVGKGATVGKMALSGLATGALGGAGYSEGEDLADIAMDSAKGGALGAGIAGGLGLAGKGISKALDKSSDSLSRAAENLAENATGATAKQAEKFRPGAGRELLDRKIVQAFDTPEHVANRSANLLRESGENIGKALTELDELGGNVSRDEIALTLMQKIDDLKGNADKAPVRKKLEGFLKDILDTPTDSTPLTLAENTKRGFQRKSNYLKPNTTEASKIVADVYKDAVEKAATDLNPDLAQAFTKSKSDFGLMAPIAEASQRRASQLNQSPKGGFMDVAAGAIGTGAGGLVGGVATPVARRVIAPRISSTGAVAADKLSKILKESPEMFGKYAGVLKNASVKGNLPLVHELLMRNDPEYQALIGD